MKNANETMHIGRYINHLSKLIRVTCNSRTSQVGTNLTGEQCRLMGYIRFRNNEGECVYQCDIEREFGIKRSSVASILSNLEKGGYITRECKKGDARIKKVSLTEKGLKADAEMYAHILEVEKELSKGMTDEDKKEFIRLIRTAISNLESYGLSEEKGSTCEIQNKGDCSL